MIKIGLLGAGHLGKIHLKLIREIPELELVGFFDQSSQVADQISKQFDIPAYASAESLMADCQAVDVVVPTLAHHGLASLAIEMGKHVFIEKPVTETIEEADHLLALSKQNPHLVIQVGHVERFNPALLAVEEQSIEPIFVEGHRLAMYNPRGTDVSVILDLMIHDLDVILSLVPYKVIDIQASGVAVISDTPDIANARLSFENGCVANLTASRISMKNMRRLRLFQKDAYLALDFLKKETEWVQLHDQALPQTPGLIQFPLDNGSTQRYLRFEKPEVKPSNAIQMELIEFARAIKGDRQIRVPLQDGVRALKVAHRILDEIDRGMQQYQAHQGTKNTPQ